MFPRMSDPGAQRVEAFVERWQASGASERANYQMFLSELCDVLDVPRPDPATDDPEQNLYVFDRAITRVSPDGRATTNYIDFYKAGHFVWETKQGVTRQPGDDAPVAPRSSLRTGHGQRGSHAFDQALERAYHQARDYITHLPASHGRPPFLVVCDVGHSIDLHAEFTCTGGRYERFPDPRSHRILLDDLRRPEIRERLRLLFTDPLALDPARVAAEVTRDIATRLARLAKSLEADGHDPQVIAGFLQRCLFTMFAEDIGLLPQDGFLDLLRKLRNNPGGFPLLVSNLWKEMAAGTSCSMLMFKEIARFNGGLFEDTSALPVNAAQLEMLTDAAASDWSAVEPSIFGTLLTRALDPRERHKLGAEYTPRAYVERLIRPVILDPLRDQWDATRVAAARLNMDATRLEEQSDGLEQEAVAMGASHAAVAVAANAAKARAGARRKHAEALQLVTAFHRELCALTVLDPACGTANFLYVTLEHLKRLEAEVLELIDALGGDATFEMAEYKVRPEQFLGLELSPNAVAIAQLVLWIGYFQWQHRTTGKADTGDRPLLPKTHTIRQQDAVLACDERIPRKDPQTGDILTIWDGHTTKPHPVTGREVPDETARKVLFDFVNPRRAEWPRADYIVGNPPFIGASRMRDALGDGYTEALRKAWKGSVPESADFVMFWWCKAAAEVVQGRCQRFGFITTNSIHQTFNRRVIEPFLADAKKPLHLAHAIPDHPWIDAADGAAVRIAMTVAAPGKAEGVLEKVIAEHPLEHGENEVTTERTAGVIAANLKVGADLTSAVPLAANSKLSCPGVKLHGSGFIVTHDEAESLGYGTIPNLEERLKGYRNGKDLTNRPRNVMVIDLFGLNEDEARSRYPTLYQHVLTHVKPERDQNKRATYRNNWWIFGEPRRELRPAIASLSRYIATVETSKHRFFTFLDQSILPDNKLIAIASDDALSLGILSSSPHTTWALQTGSRLGVGNDPVYVKSRCFETFPFPALDEGELKDRIRELGERLDAHRKRQQELHPGLTMTGMYNVLEKLRSGGVLTEKERQVHDQGLVTLLRQIHDELDEAVLEAYGWSDLHPLDAGCEPELLARLVAINHERAAGERQGQVRWLRPDYQNPEAVPAATKPEQAALPGTDSASIKDQKPKIKNQNSPPSLPWPGRLPEQVARIRELLAADPAATPEQLSTRFGRASKKRTEQIEGIIETLEGLGRI